MEQSRPVSHEMGCFAKICEANCESNYNLNLKSLYSSILFFFFVSSGSLIELLSLCRVQKGKGSGLQFETDGTNWFYMVYFFRFLIFFAVICAGLEWKPQQKHLQQVRLTVSAACCKWLRAISNELRYPGVGLTERSLIWLNWNYICKKQQTWNSITSQIECMCWVAAMNRWITITIIRLFKISISMNMRRNLLWFWPGLWMLNELLCSVNHWHRKGIPYV